MRGLAGNLHLIDISFYNKLSATTKIGSEVSYDLALSRIMTNSSIRYILNPTTKVKAKINNFGRVDIALVGRLQNNIRATFNAGGTVAGIANEKASANMFYSGFNIKVTL